LPDAAAFCAQCGVATATRIFGDGATAVAADQAVAVSYELEPGRLRQALGFQFELGQLIGRGGYAEVFAVRDLKLKRQLAIKVLRPDLIVTPAILTRFRREAEAVAALNHPNIVPVYDVGEADGICFIVMPLIEGESLKSLLLRQRRLPIDEVRRIVRQAADALGAAHRAGVVHRDIKPENIMLEGPERRVRLMDFGISKAMDSGETQLTGTGVIVGTPQYMSPEQASGDPNIDHRADQYSLAVVAYQMVSGRPPFEGETARAIMAKQLLEEPAPLPELVDNLPAPVSAALFRGLQKDRAKRFDSIGEFADTLCAATVGEAPTWAPTPRGEIGPTPAAQSRAARWVPWVIAAAAIVVAWIGLTQFGPSAAVSSPPLPPSPPPSPSPAAALAPPGPAPRPAPGTAPATRGSPTTIRPTAPPMVRETVYYFPTPPATDTTKAAPAVIDCVTSVSNQDWELAYQRCAAEARSNPLAARHAAELASSGRGTPVDQRAATAWYELAAVRDPQLQFLLATRFDAGIGTDRDPSRATELYLSAATGGVPAAFPIVARRLEVGIGAPRNELAALRWYERAAEGGHLASQLKVAATYGAGRLVARSDSAAQRWYEEAARQGNPTAQFEVAKLFFRGGRGVKKSEAEGLAWLEKAAAGGHEEARRELARRRR
jgi:serine/threonine-protein kinase